MGDRYWSDSTAQEFIKHTFQPMSLPMSHTLPVYRRLGDSETHSDVEQHCTSDSDMDPLENAGPFGSPERRRQVEKKLLQKLDQRVAFLVLVYIMNYMDRNNVAAARLKGLEEDLGMIGEQFNTLAVSSMQATC